MDGQRARHAIAILKRVVTMIPRGAILQGSEAVGIRFTRSNRALCDAIDSIHFKTVELADPVPMNCGAVEAQIVLDGDFYRDDVSMTQTRKVLEFLT